MAKPRKEEAGWSRLPDEWTPSPELLNWAVLKRPDLSLEEIKDQAEIFTEHWQNKRDNAEKKDWNRAFQTWIRRATAPRRPYNYRPPGGSGGLVV